MNMAYSDLLKDPRWQKKRLEILERDKWTCQHCSSTDKTLNVHHMKYSGVPWDANILWLITLCEDCHEIETDLCSQNRQLKIIAEQSGVPALFQLEIIRRSIHMDGIKGAREAIDSYAYLYPDNYKIFGRVKHQENIDNG